MKRRRILWGLLTVAVLGGAALALTRIVGPKGPPEYRIGVVLALTGRGATYGERALHGMELAVTELNTREPFRTRPIRLLVEDSESGATRALSAFNKLATVDRVPVVVGFVLSDEVLAVAPAANQHQIVLLSTAAGSDEIKQAGDFVFRNRESASLQAEAIARAVQGMGFNQIAILHSQSANGVSYRDTFKKAAEALGITVSPIIAYNEGKDDYRAEIEQLRRAAPRAVYLAGLDHEMGLILRQAGETSFRPQFFASPGAISPKLLELAGPTAEGLVSASAAFDPESADPRIRSFITAYTSRYGDAPDFIAANSYDAVRLLASFFEDGATTGPEIKQRLYATSDYTGIGGRTTFDQDGEVTKPIMLVRAQHGVFDPFPAPSDSAPRP